MSDWFNTAQAQYDNELPGDRYAGYAGDIEDEDPDEERDRLMDLED